MTENSIPVKYQALFHSVGGLAVESQKARESLAEYNKRQVRARVHVSHALTLAYCASQLCSLMVTQAAKKWWEL